MRFSYGLIGVGALSIILSILLINKSQDILNFGSLIFAISSLAFGVLWEYENRKSSQLFLDENRLQHLQIIETVEKYDKLIQEEKIEKKELIVTNTKIRQLMNKVTNQLSKEHLSKENLLKRIDSPIYTLLFHKTEEMDKDGSESKPIRDKILPSLGFQFIKGSRGVYFLPPSLMPPFKDRKDIDEWINNKIINEVPKNYRYIFSFISILDLRYCFSVKKDDLSKKYATLMESINAEELLSFSEGLTYLQKKKNISFKDLIEIPNLFFLLDNTSISSENKCLLKNKNDEILRELEKEINIHLYTATIAGISSEILKRVLEKYVLIMDADIEIIKNNAQFWVDLFENKQLAS